MGQHKNNRGRWKSLEEVVITDHKHLFIAWWLTFILQVATLTVLACRIVKDYMDSREPAPVTVSEGGEL